MATYFVASGGSNTSPYDTWAKAATSLATALAAATTAGDIIVIQKDAVPSGDAEVAADTTYTFAADVSLISATNDGGSAYTPSAMSTSYWIGHSTNNRSMTLAGAFTVYVYGITIRNSGTNADSFFIGSSDGSSYTLDYCYLWLGSTNSACVIQLGSIVASGNSYIRLKDTTFRFSAAAHGLRFNARIDIDGGSVSSSGTAPSVLFIANVDRPGGGLARITGCDLSHVTGTLFGASFANTYRIELVGCKLGSGVVLFTASPSPDNKSGGEIIAYDCAAGDEHYHLWYSNACGDLTISTSCYVTSDGAAYNNSGSKCSWKIVTRAHAMHTEPFFTPWISVHHEGTSAITPYLEVVCDNFTPKESEVWSEWTVKSNSGSPLVAFNNSDKGGVTASATNQGASSLTTDDWSGEPATPVFIKLAPTASVTPAEIGDLCARISVAIPSKTLYVDPQIRGRS